MFNVAVLYVLFPLLTVAFGLIGAGIAYAVSAVVALLIFVRATHGVLVFPWLSIGRILTETTLAGVAAALVVESVGGPAGDRDRPRRRRRGRSQCSKAAW